MTMTLPVGLESKELPFVFERLRRKLQIYSFCLLNFHFHLIAYGRLFGLSNIEDGKVQWGKKIFALEIQSISIDSFAYLYYVTYCYVQTTP